MYDRFLRMCLCLLAITLISLIQTDGVQAQENGDGDAQEWIWHDNEWIPIEEWEEMHENGNGNGNGETWDESESDGWIEWEEEWDEGDWDEDGDWVDEVWNDIEEMEEALNEDAQEWIWHDNEWIPIEEWEGMHGNGNAQSL